MRVKCVKLGNTAKAIFFWDQNIQKVDDRGREITVTEKRFAELSVGEHFDLPDDAGHRLLTTYPTNLQVVHYGNPVEPVPAGEPAASEKKMVSSSPRNLGSRSN